jgi:hypothetical protein
MAAAVTFLSGHPGVSRSVCCHSIVAALNAFIVTESGDSQTMSSSSRVP